MGLLGAQFCSAVQVLASLELRAWALPLHTRPHTTVWLGRREVDWGHLHTSPRNWAWTSASAQVLRVWTLGSSAGQAVNCLLKVHFFLVALFYGNRYFVCKFSQKLLQLDMK